MNQRAFGRRDAPQSAGTVRTGSKVKSMAVAAIVAAGVAAGGIAMIPREVTPGSQHATASVATHWVTTQRLARYTCPSTRCGVVGELFYREGVDVLEERDGFARVSKYYDASCTGGQSDYVDSGPSACTTANGIEGGQLAEWVRLAALSTNRPADPAEGATGTAALVSGSDDFNLYAEQFVQAADKMMAQGICTAEQLKAVGGFAASQTFKTRKAYFTYCGDVKYYLDVMTGEIWRG